MSTDTLLFDLPDDGPDRLTRARRSLERAEAELERAESADEEIGLGTQKERNAVADARYELKLAEMERLRR